ncbi:hypothetical protein FSP39_005299 [Pinctada imbricata]|uniref:Uncharacterized protein n=1 Tax=Pinctada imbricata TaxID=66713 RepID=A0AA88YKG2_PINIB|nr:hypothetical protein FSP39_005299 [Pinctada imbricata]
MGKNKGTKRPRKNLSLSDHEISGSESPEGEQSIDINALIHEANKLLYGDPFGQSIQATDKPDKILSPTEVAASESIMHKKLDYIVGKLQDLKQLKKLDTIEQRLDGLVSNVSDLTRRVTDMENRANIFEDSVKFVSDKVDDFQAICNRIDTVVKESSAHRKDIDDIKSKLQSVKDTEKSLSETMKEMERHKQMLEYISKKVDSVRQEKSDLDERVIDLQTRSMKMNLIFTGLEHEHRGEDTERKVRIFLDQELGISTPIQFGNVHRYGRFIRGKPRPIVARFLYQNDLDTVLDRANYLRGTQFGIHRKFQAVIEDCRRALHPIMQRFWEAGRSVKLVRDRLYVDGVRYHLDDFYDVFELPNSNRDQSDSQDAMDQEPTAPAGSAPV